MGVVAVGNLDVAVPSEAVDDVEWDTSLQKGGDVGVASGVERSPHLGIREDSETAGQKPP